MLYSSLNIIRVTKLRRMKLARLWRVWVIMEMHAGFWWGNPKQRKRQEDLGLERNVISEMDLNFLKPSGNFTYHQV
jgi:hypothetical protein